MKRKSLEDINRKLKNFYQTSSIYFNKQSEEWYKEWYNNYISLIREHTEKGKQILDLGCGTGFSAYLISRYGYDVVGVDIHPFSNHMKERTTKNLKYVVADAVYLPFKENSFDVVASHEFIEHVIDTREVLLEMKRVLANKGILIINSPNLISLWRPLKSLIKLIKGEEGIPVWGETVSQSIITLYKNLCLIIRKIILGIFFKRVDFVYRMPDLEKAKRVGGDADSVFIANPLDLRVFLHKEGFRVINRQLPFLADLQDSIMLVAMCARKLTKEM